MTRQYRDGEVQKDDDKMVIIVNEWTAVKVVYESMRRYDELMETYGFRIDQDFELFAIGAIPILMEIFYPVGVKGADGILDAKSDVVVRVIAAAFYLHRVVSGTENEDLKELIFDSQSIDNEELKRAVCDATGEPEKWESYLDEMVDTNYTYVLHLHNPCFYAIPTILFNFGAYHTARSNDPNENGYSDFLRYVCPIIMKLDGHDFPEFFDKVDFYPSDKDAETLAACLEAAAITMTVAMMTIVPDKLDESLRSDSSEHSSELDNYRLFVAIEQIHQLLHDAVSLIARYTAPAVMLSPEPEMATRSMPFYHEIQDGV